MATELKTSVYENTQIGSRLSWNVGLAKGLATNLIGDSLAVEQYFSSFAGAGKYSPIREPVVH